VIIDLDGIAGITRTLDGLATSFASAMRVLMAQREFIIRLKITNIVGRNNMGRTI
jgi:hypothetical protein